MAANGIAASGLHWPGIVAAIEHSPETNRRSHPSCENNPDKYFARSSNNFERRAMEYFPHPQP